MTLYELLFILLFLASAVSILTTVILMVTRHRKAARKLLLSTAAVCGLYLVVLAMSDVLATPQVTRAGDNVCFDEMCFAIVGVKTQAETISPISSVTPGRVLYMVTVRMTSQSRGRPQAEGGLRGRLYKDGRYFTISETAQQAYEAQHGRTPKLTQKLSPGETILSVLVFELPREVTIPSLTLDHGFTPGYFVVGESPFFHKPPLMELPRTDTASDDQLRKRSFVQDVGIAHIALCLSRALSSIETADRTNCASFSASWPSGSTVTSSRPVRIPWPLAIAR